MIALDYLKLTRSSNAVGANDCVVESDSTRSRNPITPAAVDASDRTSIIDRPNKESFKDATSNAPSILQAFLQARLPNWQPLNGC